MFIAHKRENDKIEQPLIDHLLGTAKLSAEFSAAFNNSDIAYLIGLFHDIGKYSKEFQNRIKGNGVKCDHSTAGARLIIKNRIFGIIGAYCIAGHHGGLQNIGSIIDIGGEGTLYSRLAKNYLIPDYSDYKDEIEKLNLSLDFRPVLKPLNKYGGFSISFLIRMLYSALVDADYLDTEYFMNNGSIDRCITYDFDSYKLKLDKALSILSKEGVINEKRNEILNICINKSQGEKGIYTLTVPTGGGKTLSSMAFAINHLLKNNMNRIIYVIPYTSIIEQNAKIFKDLLGTNVVLEHHSNFDLTEHTKLKLSSENWDIPIIVTTNVQFFESLFANKPLKCRKLHNIANSVIIFDEVQMLPEEYLTPCIKAISELVYNCNSTAVFCSATQPAITSLLAENIIYKEICDNTDDLYKTFKRTNIIFRGLLNMDNLSNELSDLNQCLCVVNTRGHALKLYKMLKGEGNFHLSSLMCPKHRNSILNTIKERLNNGLQCRVISTSLIEAGVDVDFPRVYREISGLDSIIQAGGRCNREGNLTDIDNEKKLGEVHVFESDDEFSKHQSPSFKRRIEVTKQIIKKHSDITSTYAIKDYFERLYKYDGERGLDIKNIYERLENGFKSCHFEFDFKTIADDFKLIEGNTYPIIIQYDSNAVELTEQLIKSEFISKLIRSLQIYTVNVYEDEYYTLLNKDKLKQIKPGIMMLKSLCVYDMNTGLKIKEQ